MAEGGGRRWRRRARALLALLEHERALVRAGRLAELAGLLPRHERLAQSLAATPAPAAEGEAVRLARQIAEAAARNLALLEAAREGIGAASRALAAAPALSGAIGLYGPDGGRRDPAPLRRHADRRA